MQLYKSKEAHTCKLNHTLTDAQHSTSDTRKLSPQNGHTTQGLRAYVDEGVVVENQAKTELHCPTLVHVEYLYQSVISA